MSRSQDANNGSIRLRKAWLSIVFQPEYQRTRIKYKLLLTRHAPVYLKRMTKEVIFKSIITVKIPNKIFSKVLSSLQ